jgi:hypothetical protein
MKASYDDRQSESRPATRATLMAVGCANIFPEPGAACRLSGLGRKGIGGAALLAEPNRKLCNASSPMTAMSKSWAAI